MESAVTHCDGVNGHCVNVSRAEDGPQDGVQSSCQTGSLSLLVELWDRLNL